jgi:hypothetical protein
MATIVRPSRAKGSNYRLGGRGEGSVSGRLGMVQSFEAGLACITITGRR